MNAAIPSFPTSRLIDHIQRVDLRVRNIARSTSFYRDIAGLQSLEIGPTQASYGAPEGAPFLFLSSDGVAEVADPRATGLFHIAIRYPTRACVEKSRTTKYRRT
jgi:catechol 2,3-dioxygenase